MWKIWKEEFYKAASRKIVWLGVILLLAFLSFRLFAERDDYSMTLDGKTYFGQTAIEKDKQLAKKYAGVLTREKIRQIYDTYGFYYYDAEKDLNSGNFLSRFITEKFTNFMRTDGDRLEDIHFLNGKDWENNVEPYLEHEVRLDYIYGWNDFIEMYMVMLLAVYVILIIGLSPAFAEEYMLKTADILRTTRRGKGSAVWMKILASMTFALLLTGITGAYLWGLYLFVYGTQGLSASGVLLNFASFYGYCPESVKGLLLLVVFLGFAGALLTAGLTLGMSARCRNSFLALVISLACFLFPVLWVKVLGPMWLFGIKMTKGITHFMTSMPVYLPMSTGFGFPKKTIAAHLFLGTSAGAFGKMYGYFQYRNKSQ